MAPLTETQRFQVGDLIEQYGAEVELAENYVRCRAELDLLERVAKSLTLALVGNAEMDSLAWTETRLALHDYWQWKSS